MPSTPRSHPRAKAGKRMKKLRGGPYRGNGAFDVCHIRSGLLMYNRSTNYSLDTITERFNEAYRQGWNDAILPPRKRKGSRR